VTTPHANGHGPFDLAAAAAEVETGARPFAFHYRGKPYEVPPASGWPLKTLRRVGTEDYDEALAELVGTKTYEKLVEDGLNFGELRVLFAAMTEAGGVSLPNSEPPRRPASPRTSKRR
jgi:hypothetical protein